MAVEHMPDLAQIVFSAGKGIYVPSCPGSCCPPRAWVHKGSYSAPCTETNPVRGPGLQASTSTVYLLTAEQNCLELCELGVAPRLVGLLSASDKATRSHAILCLSAMATSGKGVCVMRLSDGVRGC